MVGFLPNILAGIYLYGKATSTLVMTRKLENRRVLD